MPFSKGGFATLSYFMMASEQTISSIPRQTSLHILIIVAPLSSGNSMSSSVFLLMSRHSPDITNKSTQATRGQSGCWAEEGYRTIVPVALPIYFICVTSSMSCTDDIRCPLIDIAGLRKRFSVLLSNTTVQDNCTKILNLPIDSRLNRVLRTSIGTGGGGGGDCFSDT